MVVRVRLITGDMLIFWQQLSIGAGRPLLRRPHPGPPSPVGDGTRARFVVLPPAGDGGAIQARGQRAVRSFSRSREKEALRSRVG